MTVWITNVKVTRSLELIFRFTHDFYAIASHNFTQSICILDVYISRLILVGRNRVTVARSIKRNCHFARLNNSKVRAIPPSAERFEAKVLAIIRFAPTDILYLKDRHAVNHEVVLP